MRLIIDSLAPIVPRFYEKGKEAETPTNKGKPFHFTPGDSEP